MVISTGERLEVDVGPWLFESADQKERTFGKVMLDPPKPTIRILTAS
jgi:hypothetical protein